MKSLLFSSLAALTGFVVGLGVPWPGGRSELPEESPPPRRVAAERAWTAARFSPGERMAGIAEKAASLSAEEWPAFFRSQLASPEASRLAARLWAESDPAGFWLWLKEQRDALLLNRFAGDLVRVWAVADPDAAMAGVLEIIDRRTGDLLRRAAVDAVLARDLAKGLELAVRAGDFNRFSWGVREWMKDDPGAAVRGLAGLITDVTSTPRCRSGRRRIHRPRWSG